MNKIPLPLFTIFHNLQSNVNQQFVSRTPRLMNIAQVLDNFHARNRCPPYHWLGTSSNFSVSLSFMLYLSNLCYLMLVQKPKIPRPLSQATASNRPNVFTFTPPLSKGRAGEASELSNKIMLFLPPHNKIPPPPHFSTIPFTFSSIILSYSLSLL
jgi:hypothetical protein